MPDIELLNFDTRICVFDDGTSVPITNFIDCFGDECDPDDAVVCVIGRDGFGWFHIELLDMPEVTIH